MSLSWPFKDPDERLDYSIDWSGRIPSDDSITSSVWTVPGGITNYDEDRTGLTTILWLSGGTEGEAYSILNRITTTAGRIADQTVNIKIKSK